jgi:prepilin peptidase CpaA
MSLLDYLPAPLPWMTAWILLAVSIAAAVFDIRSRRIPNWLCLVGAGAGLLANLVLAGRVGLLRSAAGLGLGFLIYFVLYLLHGMGAGDVKLMAALGAIAGPGYWFWIFVFAAVLGAVCGVALALAKGRLRSTLWNVAYLVRELASLRRPYLRHRELDLHYEKALRMPHGAAIGMAVIALAIATQLK